MLSKTNQELLSSLGLTLLPGPDRCRFLKNDPRGNSIPGRRFGPLVELDMKGNVIKETFSNCPQMAAFKEEEGLRLVCWDWVPGPGPGDFDLMFDSENELVAFVQSYFFGDNPYFLARQTYERAQLSKSQPPDSIGS